MKYELETGVFRYSRQLVLGVAYPYDFGFVPGTLAEDGDPLDAIVYHEAATYPGVVIACRVIAVVRLTQKDPERASQRLHNDRLVLIPSADLRLASVTELDDRVRDELSQFFELAVLMADKAVTIEGWSKPEAAEALIRDGLARAANKRKSDAETPPRKEARR